jgi:hypothetical protein
MNRIVIGALGALLLVAAGVFWWQGRAATEAPAAAPQPPKSAPSEDPLPEADAGDATGPDLPEVPEETKEQKRFDRLDRDRDGKITMAEMLAPRAKEFRKLDVDGNNLLTFDEWAVRTIDKFKAADKGGKGYLTRADFATTRAPPKKQTCACAPPRHREGDHPKGGGGG